MSNVENKVLMWFLEEIQIVGQEVLHAIKRDSMTALLNKEGFESETNKLFREVLRNNMDNEDLLSLVIIATDVDRFKSINDTYGHIVGDAALKAYAKCAQNSFNRPHDLVARFGGDEFFIAFVCHQKDNHKVADYLAERLRDAIQRNCKIWSANTADETINFNGSDKSIGPLHPRGGDFLEAIKASIGAAIYTPNELDTHKISQKIAALMVSADEALYATKEAGRNGVYILSEDGTIVPSIYHRKHKGINVLANGSPPRPDSRALPLDFSPALE